MCSVASLGLRQSSDVDVVIRPILYMRKLKQRRVKWLAQGETANKCLRQDYDLGLPDSKFRILSTVPPTYRFLFFFNRTNPFIYLGKAIGIK